MDDHDPTNRQVEITYIAHHIKEKNVNMEKWNMEYKKKTMVRKAKHFQGLGRKYASN